MEGDITLSILIPVFNYDCTKLIELLVEQQKQLLCESEIVLGDDCSLPSFAAIYEQLKEKYLCRIVRPEHNIGAGEMRNLLAHSSLGKWCLFLDSDTLPIGKDFLSSYLCNAESDCVTCGGFVYEDTPPRKDLLLRYVYGHQVEMKTAAQREQKPYDNFIGMSFLLPRNIMMDEGFPQAMGMGYEDAYFGCRLKERGILIHHINNPVLHSLKETSEQFLSTTRRYVYNLYQHQHLLVGKVHLLDFYIRLTKIPGGHFIGFLFQFVEPLLRKQLTGSRPSLKLFTLYKLLYLSSLFTEER